MEYEQLTQALEKANKELHRRLHELSILYDLSKEISYTLDYEQLLRLIMDSLYKVIDYHVCSSLILSKEGGKLNIRATYPVSDSFIQDVKSKIIWSVTSLTGRTFKEEDVSVVMEGERKTGNEERGIKELARSFFNVPLISGKRLVGMINISSLKENAFIEADVRFIYTIANQTSVAIEKLRAVITAENTEIISKMNEELERRIQERTSELLQTQTQLFQTSKLAALGEMSTGLAHELNQPLTGISLIATNLKKLIKRKLLKEEELNESLKDIEENITRMSNIINHIRTFARQDTLRFVHMDINDSVKGALNLLGEQLRLHNIKLIKELSNTLPMIKGELYQIEQVVINIISNARDALIEKSLWEKDKLKSWQMEIIIKTMLQKDKKGNWVCMSISDNGTGMSDSAKQKIFDPFFTTKKVGKATGLGMSISYGIVRSFNGKIGVETKKGKGTTVSVKFPIVTKEK